MKIQYIPLSIYDIRAWVGTPAIYVLDCSGAGILLPHFLQVWKLPHHHQRIIGSFCVLDLVCSVILVI